MDKRLSSASDTEASVTIQTVSSSGRTFRVLASMRPLAEQ